MKIAVGQINPFIGDFAGNRQLMCQATAQAKEAGADMIVFPELALCGYPPMDLLEYHGFIDTNVKELETLKRALPADIAVVVGCVIRSPEKAGKPIQNAAAVLLNGECIHMQAKTLLPSYDVFDEARYFEPASSRSVFSYKDTVFGVAICEDLWWEKTDFVGKRYPVDPVRELTDSGAQIIICPSASPFSTGKMDTRKSILKAIGARGVAVVYCNLAGANDNLIFDGHSLVSNNNGDIIHQCAGFSADLGLTHIFSETPVVAQADRDDMEDLHSALVVGIADYLKKTGHRRAHLGLSGGIDSALVAALAVEALGPENVHCFFLPSEFSSQESYEDAEDTARRLGVKFDVLSIKESVAACENGLAEVFSGTARDTTEENIQARIRGVLLMAYSNKTGSLLLTTGNKSELAVGYCTLYGDMCGSLSVIGDVLKTQVYELCRWINRRKPLIPERILTKPPSAELRPDQKDQDSLPEYDVLDVILTRYVVQNKSVAEIVQEGLPEQIVLQIIKLIANAEYKRRQAPPVLKISEKAFGTGRRIPLARAFFEPAS